MSTCIIRQLIYQHSEIDSLPRVGLRHERREQQKQRQHRHHSSSYKYGGHNREADYPASSSSSSRLSSSTSSASSMPNNHNTTLSSFLQNCPDPTACDVYIFEQIARTMPSLQLVALLQGVRHQALTTRDVQTFRQMASIMPPSTLLQLLQQVSRVTLLQQQHDEKCKGGHRDQHYEEEKQDLDYDSLGHVSSEGKKDNLDDRDLTTTTIGTVTTTITSTTTQYEGTQVPFDDDGDDEYYDHDIGNESNGDMNEDCSMLQIMLDHDDAYYVTSNEEDPDHLYEPAEMTTTMNTITPELSTSQQRMFMSRTATVVNQDKQDITSRILAAPSTHADSRILPTVSKDDDENDRDDNLQRRVRFRDTPTVYKIPPQPIDPSQPHLLSSLWWAKSEMQAMRSQCSDIADFYCLECDCWPYLESLARLLSNDYSRHHHGQCQADLDMLYKHYHACRGLERHVCEEIMDVTAMHRMCVLQAQDELKTTTTTKESSRAAYDEDFWNTLAEKARETSYMSTQLAIKFAIVDHL